MKMSEEPNCHKCIFLKRDYDYNDCEYTFLYTCLYTPKIVLTTKELQSISNCHYGDGRSKPVKSYKLVPEDEYDDYLSWKKEKAKRGGKHYD